jgi:sulfite reductase (NADPH) flavoprotein alpha-component
MCHFSVTKSSVGEQAGNNIIQVKDGRLANPDPSAGVCILFGTSTGNSRKVAHLTQRYYEKQGVKVTSKSTLQLSMEELSSIKNLLVVISTDGEGDPPPMAYKFFEDLFDEEMPELDQLNYSICALGDSEYDNFCFTGKELDRRFKELGAASFYPRTDCDADYSEPALQWIKGSGAKLTQSEGTGPELAFEPDKRFFAKITERRELTNGRDVSPVYHLVLDIADSGISYRIGESAEIYPQNPEWLVDKIINVLSDDHDTDRNGFRKKLKEAYEITTLSNKTIKNFARLTNGAILEALLNSSDAVEELVSKGNVYDLLVQYNIKLTQSELLQAIPGLKGREYSIASSQMLHPNELHLTIKTIRYDYRNSIHEGSASVFANETLQEGASLEFKLRSNECFSLPEDASLPIVMIGVSTGIAPFRAILQERQVSGQIGNTWLIFGNRHQAQDNLYADELESFRANGILERYDTLFSRDNNQHKYVQEFLLENKHDLNEWLRKGAHVYVCGSIKMGKSVKRFMELTFGDSDYSLLNLIEQGRWHEDIY